MRNKFKQLLTLALFTSTCQIASAYDFVVDGIYYNITSEAEHTVSTTYKTKDGNTEYVDVIIPESVQYNGEEYFVTSVGEGSFFKSSNLRSVTLPNSVTSIGIYAFTACFNLSSINTPSNLTSIGYHAFEACSNLTSFVIPDGVTSIEEFTFNGCRSLTSVEIPSSVTKIGHNAFGGCNALTSVEISEGATSIEDSAFSGCGSLTTINIPESVTHIIGNPFLGCESLPVIDGIRYADTYLVESVDHAATSITIKDGTRFIGGSFDGYYGGFAYHQNLSSITIPNSVIDIGLRAFEDCDGLTTITIPESVKYIGSGAFSGCNSLTSIEIPEGVTSIESSTFSGCHALASVSIPNRVTKIESDAFQGCTNVETMQIETGNPVYDSRNNCNAIIETATNTLLWGCKTTIIPSDIASIGNGAFKSSSITSITIPNNVKKIGELAFYECTALATVEIQEGVTSITHATFKGCSSLTSISLPGSLTSIEANAFEKCSSLASISLPENVTSIGTSAFVGCSSLASISLPGSLNTIDGSAFLGCSSLTSITIPENVTSIGFSEFRGCTSLTSIIVNATRPATVRFDTFEGLDKSACTLYVPAGSKVIYQSAEYWNDFENIVEFGPATNVITYTSTDGQIVVPYNENAFGANIISNTYENGVGTITFDGDVTSIGGSAFYGCSTLASIGDLPACTNIGERAFQGCTSLTSIGNLSACESIGGRAFLECSSLATVGDLSACKSIDEYAFFECNSLTSVGNLSACTSIGNEAFGHCSSLSNISDLSVCTSIGSSAFNYGTSLTSVGNLSACTSIGYNAFYGCYSLAKICIPNNQVTTTDYRPVGESTTILVPANLLAAYKTAENWCDIANQIISMDAQTDYEISCVAQTNTSNIQKNIGEDNLDNVIDLKISGTINSYDIFVMRNKMANLHHLDLTDAKIVPTENGFAYYGSYTTEEDKLGEYAFHNLQKLIEVKLPKSITTIGDFAFYQCYNLQNIELQEGLCEISSGAFNYCHNLCRVDFPASLKRISGSAFHYCDRLLSVHFPSNSSLEVIGGDAFAHCYSLPSIALPSSVSSIGGSAFYNCIMLKEIYLPTSLTIIGYEAFAHCNNLNTVYATAPDPNMVQLIDNAFSTYTTATLYVPYDEETDWHTSYYAYYWHTQWGQFSSIKPWRPVYDHFPINSDYDQDKGTIPGDEINADFGPNAGYILGEEALQHFKTVEIRCNGSQGGSIIVKGDKNISIGELFVEIDVEGSKWYFFCFPFDIKLSDVTCGVDGRFVFRKYDSAARAEGGTGWTNLAADEEWLKAGVGYIFQCNKSGVLRMPILDPQFTDADKSPELEAHPAENDQDASWNYVGNPYLAYYQLEDLGFEAPVTYWDGYNYVAVRTGDDDYVFQPYQAFFVQKPTDSQTVGFVGANQQTYTQSQNALAQARERRARQRINPDRLIINVTLSDGENTDQTRVVYNNETSASYEMACDASKFMSTEAVPQLFSVGGDVQYAINERPHGEVSLGYKVSKAGTYTISMTRMDTPMLLKDLKTGVTFDFTIGEDYVFEAEAGTCTNRFVLLLNPNTNRIENMTIADAENAQFYNLAGQRTDGDSDAIQIMKQGESAKKVMIK